MTEGQRLVRRGSVFAPVPRPAEEKPARPVIFPVPVSQYIGDVVAPPEGTRLFTYVFPEAARIKNIVIHIGESAVKEKGEVMADLFYQGDIELSVPLMPGANALAFEISGEQYAKAEIIVCGKGVSQSLSGVNVSFTVGIEKQL